MGIKEKSICRDEKEESNLDYHEPFNDLLLSIVKRWMDRGK